MGQVNRAYKAHKRPVHVTAGYFNSTSPVSISHLNQKGQGRQIRYAGKWIIKHLDFDLDMLAKSIGGKYKSYPYPQWIGWIRPGMLLLQPAKDHLIVDIPSNMYIKLNQIMKNLKAQIRLLFPD